MASTTYEYRVWQDFNNDSMPDDYSGIHTDQLFHIHLLFHHVLELCYPENIRLTCNTMDRSYVVKRELVLCGEFGTRAIEMILSNTGASTDFIQGATPDISSYALSLINDPCNANSKVITMVLAILVISPYDDRGEIDRALSEIRMEETNLRFKPASKSSIEGLIRVKLESLCRMKECMICLEEFLIGKQVMCLPCGHFFHENCIVRWLETSHLCPLCRFAMPS